MSNLDNKICPICHRPYGDYMEDHHLKPLTFKTRTKTVHEKDNLIRIHRICHQKIHSSFSENQLLNEFHTIDRIINHDEIRKFVKWVQYKEPNFYDKNDDTRNRKRTRKK